MRTRSELREICFAFLFVLAFQAEDRAIQERLFLESHPLDDDEVNFFHLIVDGVLSESEFIEQTITPHLRNWTFERLPLMDKTILRMAVFEMYFVDDIPLSVSISEAVLLAKKYGDDDARSYINAVLGAISKNEQLADKE